MRDMRDIERDIARAQRDVDRYTRWARFFGFTLATVAVVMLALIVWAVASSAT